jgi:phosphatidylinositol alpha-1,6-mannosyltransferase
MPIRVLALVTEAFGGHGGIAQYNRDLLSSLAAGTNASIEVHPRKVAEPPAMPALRGLRQCAARPGRLSHSLAALRAAAISDRLDIVFCGHLFMAPLAAAVARLRKAKLIVQCHGIDAWDRPSAVRRRALESADLVLCVSRFTRSKVLSWASVPPERVVVLPNTVGDAFTPGAADGSRARWRVSNHPVLLTVGRMDSRERYKGQDKVIEALPHLVARGFDVHYVILGDGDDVSRLKVLADSMGVSQRVHFEGAVGAAALVDAYRSADLFVMPSTGEGFGIAFVEAMACGTPALGLRVGGAQDALADGDLGIAVSAVDLPQAILRVLSSAKADRADLAMRVRARFGRDAFTRRVVAMVDRLTSAA